MISAHPTEDSISLSFVDLLFCCFVTILVQFVVWVILASPSENPTQTFAIVSVTVMDRPEGRPPVVEVNGQPIAGSSAEIVFAKTSRTVDGSRETAFSILISPVRESYLITLIPGDSKTGEITLEAHTPVVSDFAHKMQLADLPNGAALELYVHASLGVEGPLVSRRVRD